MTPRARITRFLRDARGATSIEYALIAVLISIVIISLLSLIGTTLNGTFNLVGSAFTATR